ncbi:hypothetical protein AVEN_55141-1 [Araneus ventricosus]|uniref:Uncharacterized protein n=1 Tax=Araneus ventricosus TaxID=182803 RepID=A0A4Y2R6H1_ARAVE|nr:hypothetical protein AVEN_55141-1 [Araneus ventricosus]
MIRCVVILLSGAYEDTTRRTEVRAAVDDLLQHQHSANGTAWHVAFQFTVNLTFPFISDFRSVLSHCLTGPLLTSNFLWVNCLV